MGETFTHYARRVIGRMDRTRLTREQARAEIRPLIEHWQRGDVVLDDTGNLFCYHNLHGWFGLTSNQTSARGHYERDELCDPLVLLVRGRKAVCCDPR